MGASSFSAFCRVTLPYLSGIGGGVCAGVPIDEELTATLLLSPTGLNTLATAVWRYSNVELRRGAYAALLIVVSVALLSAHDADVSEPLTPIAGKPAHLERDYLWERACPR